jgi:hypothetical protein
MSGAPRNSDKLNTLAIATVGVCASALVYVSIALLQAYYVNDSAGITTMADYGGQYFRIRQPDGHTGQPEEQASSADLARDGAGCR